jgi:hypothetical protein
MKETVICRKMKPVVLNGRDTNKCWHNSMDVRSLRMLHNDLLLELTVKAHRLLVTFRVFKGEKCPV